MLNGVFIQFVPTLKQRDVIARTCPLHFLCTPSILRSFINISILIKPIQIKTYIFQFSFLRSLVMGCKKTPILHTQRLLYVFYQLIQQYTQHPSFYFYFTYNSIKNLYFYFGNGIATIRLSIFIFLFFPFHFEHSTHGQQNWAEEIRYHRCQNSTFSLSTFFFFSLILLVKFRQR